MEKAIEKSMLPPSPFRDHRLEGNLGQKCPSNSKKVEIVLGKEKA